MVVQQRRRRRPPPCAIRAIRTSLMPSRAISFTAASRIRARALARAAALASTDWTLGHDSGRAGEGVRRRDPDPARGRRGARAADRRRHRADPARGARARDLRRPARARARRAGLDARRVVPGRGAVRALDQRALVARSRRPTTCSPTARRSRSSASCKPALRGELHDAYAVTEEHAGSDPSGITTTATRIDGGWRIDGEKWFVTYGDVAAVYIVMALRAATPTLFLVDAGAARHQRRRRPAVHPQLSARASDAALRGRRGRRGRRDRRRRRGRRAAARVVRRGAARDRRPRLRRDAAAARGDHRVGDRPRAGRRADHRPPGRRRSRWPTPPPTPPPAACSASRSRGWPTRARTRSSIHAKASMAKLFVQRGREPLRRPLPADLRRPRLHAHQRRRALLARAARGPHLGGHERDPAPDRRPRPRTPRRRAGAALITQGSDP